MTRKLHVASFFSGIGGFDIGFERAGMKIVLQCEINQFARNILTKHWPRTKLLGDIGAISIDDIPANANVWCAGFPCQDLSLANQGKRKGLEGERSGLFYEFTRLAEKRKPRWLVLENVPGLLNSHQGEDFRKILQRLDELGYGISWRVLDAKYFGTPQRRRRVYIVASYRSLCSSEVLFEPRTVEIVARQGLGQKDLSSSGSRNGNTDSDIYVIQHATIGRKPSAGPQAKGYRNDEETYTLDSRGSADVICATTTPLRMRNTSGISKGVDGNRYRAIGNAVNVNVIEWLGRRIIDVDQRYYG